jgi:threonine/homoserine/homoserine lactone efflux protein
MPTTSFFALFAFSFAIGLGAVISPGPVSTAIVSQSPRQGWTIGPLVTAGHAVMELVIVILIAFGLTASLSYPQIRVGIALVGGLLLLWMGVGMLLNALHDHSTIQDPNLDTRLMSHRKVLLLGVMATISNPFWFAWWITIASGYLLEARVLGLASIAAFYLGHISADFGWNTLLSTVFSGGRRWMTGRVYRVVIGLCSAFLVYLGLTFCVHSVQLLVSLLA